MYVEKLMLTSKNEKMKNMFSFQTNHVDYTENGEDCVTKCDWSDGPKKYSMECQIETESWEPCVPFKCN